MVMIFTIFDVLVITILVGVSISGMALVIDAILHIRAKRIAPPESVEHLRPLIEARQFKELMEFTTTDQTFVSQGLNAGLHRAHLGYPAMREGMEGAVGEQTGDLYPADRAPERHREHRPAAGALGTVLGMIMAFYALDAGRGNAGSREAGSAVSPGLCHTFFGLFVAIPCLVAYGFYRTKVDKLGRARPGGRRGNARKPARSGRGPGEKRRSLSAWKRSPRRAKRPVTSHKEHE